MEIELEKSVSKPLPTGRRAIKLGDDPSVSVVVASCRERDLLDACLDSILPQAKEHGAEVVVSRTDDGQLHLLEEAYPDIKIVAAPPQADIPRLRGMGMAVASGDVVALTEDHCVVSERWIEKLLEGHRAGSDIVGGSMGNAQGARAVDWGAYFSEYGFFAEDGGGTDAAPLLTGANVAYGKSVTARAAELASGGEWEMVVHQELANSGSKLSFSRAAQVFQNKTYGFWSFCIDRYEHGRDFARRRLADNAPFPRWVYLGGVAVLPFLLTARVARSAGNVHRGPFFRALPWTFSFFSAWSIGEAVGYIRGPQMPGES